MSDDFIRSVTNGSFTDTTEGVISHLHYKGMRCPVKILRELELGREKYGGWRAVCKDGRPVPLKTAEGRYIYALPGGGEIAA